MNKTDYDFAVIFDMDGVMVDSNPIHKKALKQFCKQHGYNLTESELRNKIYGRANKDWLPELFQRDLSKEDYEILANEKEALFRKMYDLIIEPVAGLVNLLDELWVNEIPCAVATSAPPENVEFTLKKTRTKKYFVTIVHEKMIAKGKPDPEVFLKTISELGYPARKCIVFEDSLAGIKAAKKAGTKVIALTTTLTRAELLGYDMVVSNFEELGIKHMLKLIEN